MERTVFTAVVGLPNVGKSSLINGLVGQDVLIVSHKPQATRNKIAAIKTKGEEQFVFFDTPGFLNARDLLTKNMAKSVNLAVNDVDCVLLVVEPMFKLVQLEQPRFFSKLKKIKIPLILVINKIDLVEEDYVLTRTLEFYETFLKFANCVFVSAKNEIGFNNLFEEIRKHEIECAHFFPSDMTIDKSEKFLVSEFFRQELLFNLHQEIPHELIVETKIFKQTSFGLKIELMIYCLRQSHKGIIIGKNGSMLKKIATKTRMKLEQFFGCKIHLVCWVKVKPKWKNNLNFLKGLGF